MNNPSEMNRIERDFLTIGEGVNLLWQLRRYRNEAFWRSSYRYGAASVALTLTPYLLPDLISKLGVAIFVFPVMASLLSVFGAYLMIVQYMLYKQSDRKYRSFLGKYNPEDIPNKPINRIFRIAIGKIVVGTFLCFAIIGQLLNGLVLNSLLLSFLP